MKLAITLVAVLLSPGLAFADESITLQLAGACSPESEALAGSISARCAPGVGLRWLHGGKGDAFWKIGLGFDQWRYGESGRPFNTRGGNASLGQLLVQHDFSNDSIRPYFQLGGGLMGSSFHTSEHPVDLAGSAALGIEMGDRFLFGAEVRALYMKLEGKQFNGDDSFILHPALRIGWRFK